MCLCDVIYSDITTAPSYDKVTLASCPSMFLLPDRIAIETFLDSLCQHTAAQYTPWTCSQLSGKMKMKSFILLGLGLSKLINASIHPLPRVLENTCHVLGGPRSLVPNGDGLIQPGVLPTSNECSDPKPDSCTFYPDCLEAHLHCGPSGYPIGYGLHYCQRFSAVRGQMSAAGKMWVTNTMLCLQRDLVVYGDDSQATTCDRLKLYAFATHADCYVKGGICMLSPADWVRIIETVSFKELFSSLDALKATLQTAKRCIGIYSRLLRNEF